MRKKKSPISQYVSTKKEPIFQSAENIKKSEFFISEKDAQELNEKYEKKFKRGKRNKIIFVVFFTSLTIVAFSYFGYFLWKTIKVTNQMHEAQLSQNRTLSENMRSILSPIVPSVATPLKGAENGRINILLLGAAGEKNAGRNLTDTVMVMSIDVKNKKVSLLSLPRDLYVKVPQTKTSVKINSVYKLGLSQGLGATLIKETVENIIGLPINYYFIVDFEGFTKIIDDIEGINIISQQDFHDTRYPGPNYSYETFSLSKGFHTLDGSTALKYVRERHSDPEGDFGRAKRQQQVIQAVKSKLFSMGTLFNAHKLNEVLDTLGGNIKTDVSLEDVGGLISLSKDVDTQNINNVVIDAWKPNSLLKVSHISIGNMRAFILVPRVGNYSEIKDIAKNIFNQNELEKRKFAIAQEDASIEIVNKSGEKQLSGKVKIMLTENLGFKNVRISQNNNFKENLMQTKVIDNSKGLKLFTLDELLKKLPAILADEKSADEDIKSDFVIMLGEDLIDIYKFETDSIEEYNEAQDSQSNFDFIDQ
ncbi:MAG: LCP family protein [Candidatus Moranbacteria bacterium]|nr:LCP family protein [Candidatus Moranbacteria bacterium]